MKLRETMIAALLTVAAGIFIVGLVDLYARHSTMPKELPGIERKPVDLLELRDLALARCRELATNEVAGIIRVEPSLDASSRNVSDWRAVITVDHLNASGGVERQRFPALIAAHTNALGVTVVAVRDAGREFEAQMKALGVGK